MNRGGITVTHDEVVASSSVAHNCGDYNALLVYHRIAGAAAGGYVYLTMMPREGDVAVEHHGFGVNIPVANQLLSYYALFRGISQHVHVGLLRTDGTHTIIIQPIHL